MVWLDILYKSGQAKAKKNMEKLLLHVMCCGWLVSGFKSIEYLFMPLNLSIFYNK